MLLIKKKCFFFQRFTPKTLISLSFDNPYQLQNELQIHNFQLKRYGRQFGETSQGQPQLRKFPTKTSKASSPKQVTCSLTLAIGLPGLSTAVLCNPCTGRQVGREGDGQVNQPIILFRPNEMIGKAYDRPATARRSISFLSQQIIYRLLSRYKAIS